MNLPYLTPERLDALGLTTAEVVASIEDLVRGLREDRAWNASKTALSTPDGRYVMATLAAADDPAYVAVKALVQNPRNPAHGLARINAIVILLDAATGLPAALLDGNWITAVRTAGLSVLAAQRLANPASSVAAFLGCGVQAQSHLRAFADCYPLRAIRAFGRGTENRDALCSRAREMGIEATASASAREAVAGADLVVTTVPAAPALVPFLDAGWLKSGAHAAIVDLAAPWLGATMRAFDRIVIDDLDQESRLPVPLVDPAFVSGDLAGLVIEGTGARTDPAQRTAFVFRGISLGDLALAALAYTRARETGQVTAPPAA